MLTTRKFLRKQGGPPVVGGVLPLWHGLQTVPPGRTAGLPEPVRPERLRGDLRSAAVARSGDRATTRATTKHARRRTPRSILYRPEMLTTRKFLRKQGSVGNFT